MCGYHDDANEHSKLRTYVRKYTVKYFDLGEGGGGGGGAYNMTVIRLWEGDPTEL